MNQIPTYSGSKLEAFYGLYSFSSLYVNTQNINENIREIAWAAIKCDV